MVEIADRAFVVFLVRSSLFAVSTKIAGVLTQGIRKKPCQF